MQDDAVVHAPSMKELTMDVVCSNQEAKQ